MSTAEESGGLPPAGNSCNFKDLSQVQAIAKEVQSKSLKLTVAGQCNQVVVSFKYE